jgi:hypothetical protein
VTFNTIWKVLSNHLLSFVVVMVKLEKGNM